MKRFFLADNKCYHTVFSSETMLDMWKYIRNTINEPRNYNVEEIVNDSFIDSIGAYYLIENYKTEESVPETLFVDEIKNVAVAFKTWCDENAIISFSCDSYDLVSGAKNLTNDQLYEEFIKSLNQ